MSNRSIEVRECNDENATDTGSLRVPTLVFAKEVTLDNLVRAETDHMIRQNIQAYGLKVARSCICARPWTSPTSP